MAETPYVKTTDYARRAGFTQVYNVVLRGYQELRAEVKLTYMVLDSFAWKGSKTFAGLETLAQARGLAEETVSRHCHELEEIGLLEIEQRGRKKTNVYTILPPSKERVDAYLEEWSVGVESDLSDGSTQSESDLTRGSSHSGGDLTRGSSPVVKEDEGTYEEDEVTTRGSSPEDLKLINEIPGNTTTKWGRRLQAKLRQYSGRDLNLITTYLEIAEEDPNTKAKSDQGKCSRLDELRDLEDEFGHDAWVYALQECRRLGKAGTAYARTIMKGYDPNQEAPTAYDKPSAKNPVSNNPTDETIVGWDALDEVTNNDD